MRLRGPALVAALATAACLAGCGDAQFQRPPEGTDKAGASSWDSLGPGWTSLAPPPFPRSEAVSVWADDALLCLEGELSAQIHGDSPFVKAVFEGLGVRDLRLGDPAP
jgi:hypothetical protein